MQLYVVGLGVRSGDLSVSACEAIRSADFVLLRTAKTASAGYLDKIGITPIALDYVYEKSKNFDTLSANLVKEVRSYLKKGTVAYLADGAVSEDVCAKRLIKSVKGAVVFEGVSKVTDALVNCGIGQTGYTAVSAYSINEFKRFSFPLVIYDLDSRLLASEWKLKLFNIVSEDIKVRLYARYRAKTIRLYELDNTDEFDYSTVLIVEEQPLSEKQRFDFYDLMEILRVLRSPNGCPWDKAQTVESIRKNLVEEAYELIDAVDKKDDDKMKEETGDLLLQVAFNILFAEERGAYNADDVISALCYKLVFRHTHIFGSDKAASAEAALEIWNKNKKIEKGYDGACGYVDDVPKCLPALLRTEKVIKRSLNCNFDVYSDEQLTAAISGILSDKSKLNERAGEALFYLTYLIKRNGGSPEENLADETKAFISRLEKVENALLDRGADLRSASRDTVLKLYNET